jgi:hypothetical protein
MSKQGIWCAAVSAAALAIGVPTPGSAAVSHAVHSAPARASTAVRTNTRVNTVRTPQTKTTVKTTTTTQFRKLNTGGTGAGTGAGSAKFHKSIGSGTAHLTPATLKVTPNLKLSPATKLGASKFNPVISPQNKLQYVKLGNNKFAPVWKQKHGLWWGGKWKYFVPFTALGAVLIGGGYYYPDAYVGFARPYCTGITPDGCQLNWQQVNFEDGGGDWQCVQFCPRPGAMPPPHAAALVAPPPVPQGSCEVTIFSDPNFAGTPVTTGEEQPTLSQSGWQNQIASIQVKSGTWDFFTDENFTGAPMRLKPGPYQDLGPEWTKKIGSFMCVQPGQ